MSGDVPSDQQTEPMLSESGNADVNDGRQGSLSRAQGQGSLPRTRDLGSRNSGSMERSGNRSRAEPADRNDSSRRFLDSSSGTADRAVLERETQRLELQRHCEKETRFFAAFQFVLLILQALHSAHLSYINKKSHSALYLDTTSGGFVAGQVMFPLLIVLTSVPACLWIAANAWDFCDGKFWKKLKSEKGFIAFHMSMIISTLLYTIHLIYVMARNFNAYFGVIGSDATCFCNDVSNPDLDVNGAMFHCKCMVPKEIPWHIATPNIRLIDDVSLQNVGSNYTGHVVVKPFNSTMEMFENSQAFFPDFKKSVYVVELCVLIISLRVLTWGWTSEYAWRKMTKLPENWTIEQLRDYRRDIMMYAAFCFGEGIDFYALLSDLMDYARDLTMARGMANWLLATAGISSFIAHLLLPCAFVKFVQLDRGEMYTNKIIEFLVNRDRMTTVSKMVTVVMNLFLFFVRVSLFRMYGGMDGMLMRNLFLLFILKEFFVIVQKGSEFCIECWELKKKKS